MRFAKNRTANCFGGRLALTFKPQTLGVLVASDELLSAFEALIDGYAIKPETRAALKSVAAEFAMLLVATLEVKVLGALDETETAFVEWLGALDVDEANAGDLWAVRLELPDGIVAEWSQAYLEAQRLNADAASAPAETLSKADAAALEDAQSPLA